MDAIKRKVDKEDDDADAKVPKLIPAATEKKFLDTSDVIDFCKLMKKMIEFCDLNDSHNARVKTGFAENLASLTAIVDPLDIYHHMCPIALQLVMDPVAEVREAALLLINRQLRRLNSIEAWLEEEEILDAFIKRLVYILCYGVMWVQRQSFAILSGHIINSGSLGPNTFAQYFLSHLVSLVTDKAPSVRIRVAQAFSFCRTRGYYTDPTNPYNSILVDTITKLQNDADEDVKDMIMMKEKKDEKAEDEKAEDEKEETADGEKAKEEKADGKKADEETSDGEKANEEKRKVGKCCLQCGFFNEKWQFNRNMLTNCIICNFRIDWPKK